MFELLTSKRLGTPSSMRVLSVSGGGLLGVIPAAMLLRFEALGQRQYGPEYRLRDSFDLVGGTSTGAVIATGVALGLTASEIADFYLQDVPKGFQRRRVAVPMLHDLFDGDLMQSFFKQRTEGRCLTRAELDCHLAITVKDLTASRPVVFSTLPGDSARISLGDIDHRRDALPIDLLLRAGTAAPGLFSPVEMTLDNGAKMVAADGGLSPFNDPGLLLARLAWEAGAGKVDLTSLGTGRRRPSYRTASLMRGPAFTRMLRVLLGVIRDSEEQTHHMLKSLASTPSAPLGYRKVNMELDRIALDALGVRTSRREMAQMRSISSFSGKSTLFEAAQRFASANIDRPLPLARRAS